MGRSLQQFEALLPEEARAAREIFALLIGGYSALAARQRGVVEPPDARIRALLDGFLEVRTRSERRGHISAFAERDRLQSLLAGYLEATIRHRRQQEESADDFHLLDVLQLTDNELRHSMALAWLLDGDMRRLGTHAQGNLGFRLFLKQFQFPPAYAEYPYRVRREVPGEDSIVDIEVACRGKFLIHVENKIWSSEGADQTNREWRDVQRRAASLGLDPADESLVLALFLTPRGSTANNAHFRSISWGDVATVFEAFADQAKPPEVKLFAAHYARALRRFIVSTDSTEGQHGQGTVE